jgi:cytochrome c biogenesis protein CcmG, thiol:disulfide interchange protein DsbE
MLSAKKLSSLFACTILTGVVAAAADRFPVLHAGDESFTNVTVTSVTPTDLYFSHSAGMGNVKLKNLDPALQKRFNYNPTKAADLANAQAEATKRYYMEKAAEKPPVITPEPEEEPAPEPAATNRPPGIRLETVKARRFLGEQPPQLMIEKWLTATPPTPGKFVLVDFWATWCAPCRSVIPNLNAMQEKYKNRLVIIGLSDESESAVKLMSSPRIEYAVAIDTKARTKKAVQVEAIPHALLMDPQGFVRFEGNPQNLTEEMLAQLLATYAE